MLSYCPHANIISSRAPLQNDKRRLDHACARNGTTTSHPAFLILPDGLSHHPSNHMNGHVVSKRHPVPGPGYQIVDPPLSEILPRQSKMTPSPRPDPGPGSKTTVRFNVSCSLQNSHDDLPRISETRERADQQHRLLRNQFTQTDPQRPAPSTPSRSPSAHPGPVTCNHHRAEEPPRLRARGAVTRASGSARARYSDSSYCSSSSSGKGGAIDSSDSADSSFSVVSARDPAEEYPLSVILIGDSGAGKTCLVARLADNVFVDNYDVTVGIDFNVARFELTDGRPIRLQMWDTAGQEKYRAITSSYYRKAMGVVLVYDVTRRESLENILGVWQKEVEKYAEPDVALMLVGNKMDLDDYRTITTRVGARLASQLGAIFYEVSAKEDLNVRSAFQAFADDIMENVYSKRNPCLSPDAVHLDHSNNDRKGDKTKSTCNCS